MTVVELYQHVRRGVLIMMKGRAFSIEDGSGLARNLLERQTLNGENDEF